MSWVARLKVMLPCITWRVGAWSRCCRRVVICVCSLVIWKGPDKKLLVLTFSFLSIVVLLAWVSRNRTGILARSWTC